MSPVLKKGGIPLMKKFVALSAIGKDQPGIVASLSKVLFEAGCNLEDSSMTRLQGDFAVLLLISLPGDLSLEKLKQSLQEKTRLYHLTLALREIAPEEVSAPIIPTSLPYTLVVYGVDHPGIVYRVTQAAAEEKINITDLRTRVTSNDGTPIYSLVVEVEILDKNTVKLFEKKLDSLKKELEIEIFLKPVEADEL